MADAKTIERYLSILGIETAPPGLDHLTRLVRAQLTRVPFENISKLYLKKTQGASYIPSLEEHLDGIERFSFGGTCYANNPYFSQLLRHLGYDVDMCGADMSKPDVHVVSIVRLEGREYPAGSLVPAGSLMPPKEKSLRDSKWIASIEVEFMADRLPQPRDSAGFVPGHVLEDAAGLVHRLHEEFVAAQAWLAKMVEVQEQDVVAAAVTRGETRQQHAVDRVEADVERAANARAYADAKAAQ